MSVLRQKGCEKREESNRPWNNIKWGRWKKNMNQVCVFLLSDQMKCALMEATNKCVVYVVILVLWCFEQFQTVSYLQTVGWLWDCCHGDTRMLLFEGAMQPPGLMASWQTVACPPSNICSFSLCAIMSPYHYPNSLYKHFYHEPQVNCSIEKSLLHTRMLNDSTTFNSMSRSDNSMNPWQLHRDDDSEQTAKTFFLWTRRFW